MDERHHTLRDLFFERRELPFFEGIGDYIRTRQPSDQLIFAILGGFIAISGLLGFFALEQSLLVVEPVYGGSLTEGDVGVPRFINPLLALSTTDQDLTALTYAGLMGEGANGTLVPVLAKSYIVSPDGKVYQFTLRSDAKFSDGTPVTADDVVFTIQKAKDPALKSPQASNWAGVAVKEIDAHTVQFTLSTAYAPFIYDTTLGILPAHLWRNIPDDSFPFSDLQIKPVGAGPFVPHAVTRDSDGTITSYDLSENQNYPAGRPYLDSMRFVFYPDQTALHDAILKNQIESGYGVAGRYVLTAPYARVFAVFFNVGNAASGDILAKTQAREALSMAIDRTAIVKNMLGDYATALGGPVPAGSGVNNVPAPSASDRVNIAKDLLSQAGVKANSQISITLKTSTAPELKVLAQAIQANWKDIGVTTSLQMYEPGDLTQNVIRPRAFQALLFGMVIGKGDDLYDFWDSKQAADPGLNITGYSNSDVDKLLSKLRTETDPVAHTADLAQINTLIAADYPAAFIESPDFVYSVPNDLKGVILPQITAPSDRFATVANWYRRTESVWPFLAKPRL